MKTKKVISTPPAANQVRRKFDRAVAALRDQAAKTPAGKLTMRQMDSEIAAARRDRKRNSNLTK